MIGVIVLSEQENDLRSPQSARIPNLQQESIAAFITSLLGRETSSNIGKRQSSIARKSEVVHRSENDNLNTFS